jgi:hypothetical protein
MDGLRTAIFLSFAVVCIWSLLAYYNRHCVWVGGGFKLSCNSANIGQAGTKSLPLSVYLLRFYDSP